MMQLPPATVCRSCRSPIRWVVTAATGKAMPINAQACLDGNLRLDVVGLTVVARVLKGEQLDALRTCGKAFLSHYVTCPQGPMWRLKKKIQKEE